MKSKLPRSTLLRSEEQKDESEELTLQSFGRRLLHYVNIQEVADYHVQLLQKPKDFIRYHPKE